MPSGHRVGLSQTQGRVGADEGDVTRAALKLNGEGASAVDGDDFNVEVERRGEVRDGVAHRQVEEARRGFDDGECLLGVRGAGGQQCQRAEQQGEAVLRHGFLPVRRSLVRACLTSGDQEVARSLAGVSVFVW